MLTEVEVRAVLDQVVHPTFGMSLIALNMVRGEYYPSGRRSRSGDELPRLSGRRSDTEASASET